MVKNKLLLSHFNQLSIMKQLLYCLYISVFCCFYSCQRESVAEYRMEQVDSIHISYYGNRLNSYVCIDNQEDIDSLCDSIRTWKYHYTATTKNKSLEFQKNILKDTLARRVSIIWKKY